ncbi:(3 5-dihydroxyphenyl)acetyl-CoA 1 2-dioxygenase, partial [Bienertia sinuspersici]
VKIELEDIKSEIEFWNSAIICYVLGAIPPIGVFEGFIRRIWRMKNVDKVANIKNGIFLVRFESVEDRDMILNSDRPFFVHKPVIMKPWTENVDCTKDSVRSIPIWIQLYLDFKYWGIRSLEKIVGKVGKLVKVDQATEKRRD